MWIFTVVLVGLQVVSAVVCRGAEHSAKRVVVRYLSHNAKFVYNGTVVAIVKPVFHNFELIFYGGKCTKLFLIEVFFACILKNKGGKTKEYAYSLFRPVVYFESTSYCRYVTNLICGKFAITTHSTDIVFNFIKKNR